MAKAATSLRRARRARRAPVTRRSLAGMAAEISELRAEVAELRRRLERRNGRQARGGESRWQPWMAGFLEALRASGGNASAAIDAVAVSRWTVYDHRQRCHAFRAAWDAALKKLAGPAAGSRAAA